MRIINLSKYGFHLSQKSKAGLAFLLALLLLLIGFRFILQEIIPQTNEYDNQKLMLAWKAYKKKNLTSQNKVTVSDTSPINTSMQPALFYFDPNTISKERLQLLGLSLRTIYTWLHYREKGGRFFKKEDVKRLYTLSVADYERLKPYIQLPDSREQKSKEKPISNAWHQHSNQPISLNSADTQMLKALPGIGSVLALRIISFRNALGGYFEIQQLKEVYHLPDSIYSKISGRFIIDLSKIKKIDLNSADYKEFSRHPYLRPYVKQLLILRKRLGKFSDIRQIQQISLINAQNYRKIAPYLKI